MPVRTDYPTERFRFASTHHAKEAVHRLDRVLDRAGHAFAEEEVEEFVAHCTGHPTWQSLMASAYQAPASDFDEMLPIADVTERLMLQSRRLSGVLGVHLSEGAMIIAETRLTAHPKGPHFLPGPSSSTRFGETNPHFMMEYRGLHPERGPLVYRLGELCPVASAQSISSYIYGRDRVASAASAGVSTIIPSVNTKIFMFQDTRDIGLESAIALYQDLTSLCYCAVLASSDLVGYGGFTEFVGPTYGAVPVDRAWEIPVDGQGPDNTLTWPLILKAASYVRAPWPDAGPVMRPLKG